jgi:hypothetical protein
MAEVRYDNGIYWVGNWSFDEDEIHDINAMDEAIEAWTAFRDYAIKVRLGGQL